MSTKINLLLLHNAKGKCYNTMSVYPFSLSESSTLSATSIISIKIPPVFRSENGVNAFIERKPVCRRESRVQFLPPGHRVPGQQAIPGHLDHFSVFYIFLWI